MQIIPLNTTYVGGDLTSVFDAVCMKTWQKKPGTKLVSKLMEELLRNVVNPTDTDKSLIKSAREIARLADESGLENPYHNPHHTAIVTMMAAYFYVQREEFNQHDYLLLLCNAAGHDLGHPGHVNPKDNPILNETIAANAVCEVMDRNNVNSYYQYVSRGIIISTSIDGPHEFLRHLTHTKFNEQGAIATNRNYRNMARILCDADVFASSGTNLEISSIMGARLSKESKLAGTDVDFTTPQSRAYFLDTIIGKAGFMSEIAKKLANENFYALRNATAAEIKLLKTA